MTLLVSMGFSESIARKALKATNGSVEASIDWIDAHRDEEEKTEGAKNGDEEKKEQPVVHSAICNSCKKQIVGVRYRVFFFSFLSFPFSFSFSFLIKFR